MFELCDAPNPYGVANVEINEGGIKEGRWRGKELFCIFRWYGSIFNNLLSRLQAFLVEQNNCIANPQTLDCVVIWSDLTQTISDLLGCGNITKIWSEFEITVYCRCVRKDRPE